MSQFQIVGGKKLEGEIEVKGAKNAALKVVAASFLAKYPFKVSNFPFIEDTCRMIEMAESVGVKTKKNKNENKLVIEAKNINQSRFSKELTNKLRSSILFAGPMLAREKEVEIAHPGGCVIGKRPIDLFIEGYKKFGVIVRERDSYFIMKVKRLRGARIFFPRVSVTATEAMMMTAVLADGVTELRNAAMEPEISMLANFLNSCGARISGAGTPNITIRGVKEISGGELELIPDRIEAGTFIILGALAGKEVRVKKMNPLHIEALLVMLKKAGVRFRVFSDSVTVVGSTKRLRAVNIQTHEYPGFATDLQPPFTLLMTQAKGICLIHDPIFDGRLMFTDILNSMGANIIMNDPHRVTVSGPSKLFGRRIVSPDLRAGITLVLAGLIAKGMTVIDNIYQIDRGYEKIEERLQKLGAEIIRT